MRRYLTALVMLLTGILASSHVVAQNLPPQVRFEQAPQIGEMIPDLTIVDDKGNPANLRSLTSGHYTVMTLGCLT